MFLIKKNRRYAMNVKYINPFIKASSIVLKQMCGVEVQIKNPYVKKDFVSEKEVIIMIGITGDIKGHVLFSIKDHTACWLASKIMFGMEVTQLDDMSKSAIGELGNMILGNTSTFLSQDEIEVDITPPTLLLSSGLDIVTKDKEIVSIPLELDSQHHFEINIILKDG